MIEPVYNTQKSRNTAKGTTEALDALDRIADKVLNYRPKDRQPKPPKPKAKKKKTGA